MNPNLSKDHTALKSRCCVDCGVYKGPKEFGIHKHPHAKDGYIALPRCKDCTKLWKFKAHLKRSYGLEWEDYLNMVESQEGKCLLCGSSGSKEHNRLVVDHCHSTGKVRGLLCWNCNIGIGMFKDNPKLLKRVISYLA